MSPNTLIPKAMQLLQSGKWREAEKIYFDILSKDSRNADALHLLGMLYYQRGEYAKAARYIQSAIEVVPNFGPIYSNLGNALDELGRFDEAIQAHRKAIELQPAYANAYLNLGNIYAKHARYAEAVELYQKAVALDPNQALAWSGLGLALIYLNRLEEATEALRRALSLSPQLAMAHLNYAHALTYMKSAKEEAVSHYRQAMLLEPHYVIARAYLGNRTREITKSPSSKPVIPQPSQLEAEPYAYLAHAYFLQSKIPESIGALRTAIEKDPSNHEYWFDLGRILQLQGDEEEAAGCYNKAKGGHLDTIASIRHALNISSIADSRQKIEQSRMRISQEVEQLMESENLEIDDPYRQWGQPNFFLAYQGEDDVDIQRNVAQLYSKACKSLTWTSPHIAAWKKKPPRQRTRIGIISMNLYNHTIGKLNKGWIERLDRERFEVVWLRIPVKDDAFSRELAQRVDRVSLIPTSTLNEARHAIAAEELDILFFTDIGMDAFTYFLSYARLAPVQCVTWGHPVTTGIPNLDYFISSRHIEPEDAQSHYSEKLVLFDHLPCYYELPVVEHSKSRAELNLPDDARLYMCPQSLFKFHPDFDEVLGEILRRDDKALLVMIEGAYKNWTKKLSDRFQKAFPDQSHKVRFLPALSYQDFLNLQRLSDALLDPPHFGGGNTTYEALSMGCPIITWPGPFMRGRVTEGCYRQMEITDLIANSREEYIEMVNKLANNAEWRESLRKKILASRGKLFNTQPAIHEFEQFFAKAVAEARSSSQHTLDKAG